jgi:hypothetical protein
MQLEKKKSQRKCQIVGKIMLKTSPVFVRLFGFFPAIGIAETAVPRTEKQRSKFAGQFTATEGWDDGDGICATAR